MFAARLLLAHVDAVVPEVDGWMELVERHPTIYLRTQTFNVGEQEVGHSARTWSTAGAASATPTVKR